MALSSGGWAQVSPTAAMLAGEKALQAGCGTVLMSVRVSVSHSGLRPLCFGQAGDDSLRLQLSMDPNRVGEFRLAMRAVTNGRSVSLQEFDLRNVRYEICSPRCHELYVVNPPHDTYRFNFRSEQEAQEWATVMMSSLREAHRVAGIVHHLPNDTLPYPKPTEQNTALSLSAKEELCTELARAIEAGDTHAAVLHATTLAYHQMALTIQPALKNSEDGEISLAVAVEDATSSCCVTVKAVPHMTVASLKQQMFAEYGFHPRVQRWVIGQCLCSDQRSLASYGACRDGDTAFLYLLSARHARLSRQQCQQDQENALLSPTPKPTASPGTLASGPAGHDWRGYSTLPPRLNHSTTGESSLAHAASGSGRVWNATSCSADFDGSGGGAEKHNIGDIISLEILQPGGPNMRQSATQLGWSCPSCTFINKSTRPGCEICSSERPNPPDLGTQQATLLS